MTQRTRGRTGLALHITVGIIALSAITWMGIASVPSSTSRIPARFRIPPNSNELTAALGSAGLTPQILAASGLSPQQVSVFVAAAASSLRANFATYRTVQDDIHRAGNEVSRLQRRIRSGQGSPEDVTALASAQANLDAARAQRQSILDATLADASQQLAAPLVSSLTTFRVHKLAWDLPERFLGDPRDEAGWVALRDALANERIAARSGSEPDPAAQHLLQVARATTRSVAAQSNLAHLPEIAAAWNTAIGQ